MVRDGERWLEQGASDAELIRATDPPAKAAPLENQHQQIQLCETHETPTDRDNQFPFNTRLS